MTPAPSDSDEQHGSPGATAPVLVVVSGVPGDSMTKAVTIITSCGNDAVSPLERGDGATTVLPPPTTSTSAGAAITRSLLLFMGFMFRRPSKLFRPNRLDTWAGLRQLAESADQNLSPSFVRSIFKLKGGPIVVAASLLPPLLVNTTLGFLLFSSHSLLSLWLARLPYFHRRVADPVSEEHQDLLDELIQRDFLGGLDGDYGVATGDAIVEEEVTFETIIRGPRTIPAHPTLLSAIAGAGAGVIQGMAFTPIENIVKFFQQSAASVTAIIARFLRLPTPKLTTALTQSLGPGPPPASPLEALRNLFAGSSWHKSQSWWSGWRWAVGRDAVSYSVFFATFDITRRVGLRVKATCMLHSSGDHPTSSIAAAAATPPPETPLKARLAQAGTIVAGGIVAATAAEAAGRPFRQCSRLVALAARERGRLTSAGKESETPWRYRHPIRYAYQKRGAGFFFHSSLHPSPDETGNRALRALQRFGWRVASVTPWGLGFLVFAYIGGEV